MRKLGLFILLISIIGCLGAIYFKYFDVQSNKFTRTFQARKVKLMDVHEFDNEKFGFINISESEIYIYFYTDLEGVYNLNYKLTFVDSIKLRYPLMFNKGVARIRKDIFNKNIYTMNILGDIAIFKKDHILYKSIKNLYIDRFQTISLNSMVARSNPFEKKGRIRRLVKINISGQPTVEKTYTFPDHKNNIFYNDGKMYFDSKSRKLFYLYYYRGEIVSLDTNLKVLRNYKTIDTIKYGDIKAENVSLQRNKNTGTSQAILSKPQTIVNSAISISNGYLYVQSRLKSDNETQTVFDRNQVIDVYNMLTGKYGYSFYVPKYRGLKMKDFQIKGNLIISIFGKYLVTYEIESL